jgi:hypothetical protein
VTARADVSACVHRFEHVRDERHWARIEPGTFSCAKCGLVVQLGGAVEHPRDAHDSSYRPDLPLRSSDATVAKWADGIGRGEP